MTEKSIQDLLLSYERNFDALKKIVESLSHEKRLQILLSLLTGNKSFRDLKKEAKLEKTALANHLNRLILAKLVYKPAYNTYSISSDGERFLRSLEGNYQESEMKIIQDNEKRETRKFSDSFVRDFFNLGPD